MLRTAACIASIAAALALASPAAADRGNGGPGKPSSSSIALAQSAPSWGDHITFNVATTVTAQPYVNLMCYQGGELVAEGWAGYFAGALGDGGFGLYSPIWTSGAADCIAYLDDYANGRWKQLASTSFHVNA